MKKPERIIPGLVFFFCLVYSAYPQDKLFFLGGSKTFNPDSIGYTVSFSFNRTESSESAAGPLIKAWPLKSGALFLKPSASADLGSIPKIAEDNVYVNLSLGYHMSLKKGFLFIIEFSPNYTSDKNFQTGLLFAEILPKFGYRYFIESVMEHLIVAKIGLDYGDRLSAHSAPNSFFRIIPDLSYKLALFPKKNKDSTGEKVFQYFLLTCNFEGTLYWIKGDKGVIADGSYGYFMGSIDFRICKNIALTLKYVTGYVQPSYKQVNALSLGFSIYQ